MVDVGHKSETARRAIAEAVVRVTAEVRALVLTGQLQKGEALAVARIAGIQAAKDTARLVPLCHPLPLSHVGVEFEPLGVDRVRIVATAATTARTGVEMEAMAAASVSALALYDMVKGRCRDAEIERVRLLEKHGGKSGSWRRADGGAS
jgi:cyclic pyranopterin phosphate synthase